MKKGPNLSRFRHLSGRHYLMVRLQHAERLGGSPVVLPRCFIVTLNLLSLIDWSQRGWCLWGKDGSRWFLIFTSQWPQTEDTIGKRVFPRRPENATPRYLGLLLWTEIKLKANIRRSKKQSRKTYLSLTIKDMVPKSMSSSIRIVSGTLTDLIVFQLCWHHNLYTTTYTTYNYKSCKWPTRRSVCHVMGEVITGWLRDYIFRFHCHCFH